MNQVTIPKSAYKNNPDLLMAILFTHFEDVLVGELQVHEDVEFEQKH